MLKILRIGLLVALVVILLPAVHFSLAQTATCPDAPPSRLAVGMRATVTPPQPGIDATPVRVRDAAGKSGNVIAQLHGGDQMTIIGGPTCADGYVWWQIKSDGGVTGWVAEGTSTQYFIDPSTSSAPTGTPVITLAPTVGVAIVNCPDTPPTQLNVAFRGVVRPAGAGKTPNSARIRDKAGKNGKVLGNLPEGVAFTVIGGPTCADSYVWWQIKADNGLTGWTAEGDPTKYYIEPISFTYTPTPQATAGLPVVIPIDCPNAPSNLFGRGMTGVVTRDSGVRVHVQPDVNSDVNTIPSVTGSDMFNGILPNGTSFKVSGDPTCNAGIIWLGIYGKVNAAGTTNPIEVDGYIAENDGGTYNVGQPSASVTATPQGTAAPVIVASQTPAIAYPTAQPSATPTDIPLQVGAPLQPPPTLAAPLPLTPTPLESTNDDSEHVADAAFSPDGRYALVYHGNGVSDLWDVASGAHLRRFSDPYPAAKDRFGVYAENAVFSPDGRFIVSEKFGQFRSAPEKDTAVIIFWNIETGAVRRQLFYDSDGCGSGARYSFGSHEFDLAVHIMFSPDGKQLLVADGSTNAFLVNITSGAPQVLSAYNERVQSGFPIIAFSPDGHRVAIRNQDQYSFQLIDTTHPKLIRYIGNDADTTTNSYLSDITFSPDGRLILETHSGDKNEVRLWDVATQVEREPTLQIPKGQDLNSAVYLHSGKQILTVGSKILLWDATTGKMVREFAPLGSSWGIAVSPDDRFALSADKDGIARLWDIVTGLVVRQFPPQ